MEMEEADVRYVLEFLRAHNLMRTEEALLSEISEREESKGGSQTSSPEKGRPEAKPQEEAEEVPSPGLMESNRVPSLGDMVMDVPVALSSSPVASTPEGDDRELREKFMNLSAGVGVEQPVTLNMAGFDSGSPPSSPPLLSPSKKSPPSSHTKRSSADGDVDEYDDEEDAGYLREEVGDPAAFLAGVETLDPELEEEDVILPNPTSPPTSPPEAVAGAAAAGTGGDDGFSFGVGGVEAGGQEAVAPGESEAEGKEEGEAEEEATEPMAPGDAADPYETFNLKIIHRRGRTGFEESKDFPIRLNTIIAGRYQLMEFLGSAAFSKAVQALDLQTGMLVCIKIIKNNKDFFDQSLDEIKLLKYINRSDPADTKRVLRLYDFFYYKEHLFIVCELLRANLYEFQKYNRESVDEPYFSMKRLQSIAKQALVSLDYLHSLDLIHCDLKPENILIKSYSRCEVKIIDLGSSCFTTDHLSSYVQSRSYRAPEVILGAPYGQKIDLWSMGCILAELHSGLVLFQNDSLATLLARVIGILGPVPNALLSRSRLAHKYFDRTGRLYECDPQRGQVHVLHPKRTTLRHRLPGADPEFVEFVRYLLTTDPDHRPTAAQALQHKWLTEVTYPDN